jgi:hypothetical protein
MSDSEKLGYWAVVVISLASWTASLRKGSTVHTLSCWIFIVSVILALVALVGALHVVPALMPYTACAALAGWLVLTLGCLIKTT